MLLGVDFLLVRNGNVLLRACDVWASRFWARDVFIKLVGLFGCPFGSANLGGSIESARVRV